MSKKQAIFDTVKFGTELGVAIGVGIIAGAGIASIPLATGGIIAQVCIKMGAIAIESAVIDNVVTHVEFQFNNLEIALKKSLAEGMRIK